jgi:YHS domain-containing protein
MKSLAIVLVLAGTPVLAHQPPSNHAKKGEHQDAPSSFDKQPAVGTWARCPVSGDIFRVGPKTEFATYKGRVYAFCCDECKPDFDKDPGKYATGK